MEADHSFILAIQAKQKSIANEKLEEKRSQLICLYSSLNLKSDLDVVNHFF